MQTWSEMPIPQMSSVAHKDVKVHGQNITHFIYQKCQETEINTHSHIISYPLCLHET